MIWVIRGCVTWAKRASSDWSRTFPSRRSRSKWMANAIRREIRGTRPAGGAELSEAATIARDRSGRRVIRTFRVVEITPPPRRPQALPQQAP